MRLRKKITQTMSVIAVRFSVNSCSGRNSAFGCSCELTKATSGGNTSAGLMRRRMAAMRTPLPGRNASRRADSGSHAHMARSRNKGAMPPTQNTDVQP